MSYKTPFIMMPTTELLWARVSDEINNASTCFRTSLYDMASDIAIIADKDLFTLTLVASDNH